MFKFWSPQGDRPATVWLVALAVWLQVAVDAFPPWLAFMPSPWLCMLILLILAWILGLLDKDSEDD
ncbi:MAG: hypothetical protein AMXMBFR7_52650 [Planctomycetota bacterium]